ncbi:hypothetical protein RJT34_14090 [Clitoria ternatea]|uniref:Uncharacterized protein n=1 Tax=Clitoria ternatea TaxID=43366 RepID=A0AAN9JQ45_CLITE
MFGTQGTQTVGEGSGYVPSPITSPTAFVQDLLTPNTPLVTHRGEGSSHYVGQGLDLNMDLAAAADTIEENPRRNPHRVVRDFTRQCIVSPDPHARNPHARNPHRD